jgi:hypothetical protein
MFNGNAKETRQCPASAARMSTGVCKMVVIISISASMAQSIIHRPIASLGQFIRAKLKREPSIDDRLFDGGHKCG